MNRSGLPLPVASFIPVALVDSASVNAPAGQAALKVPMTGAWSLSGAGPFSIDPVLGSVTTTGAVVLGSYSLIALFRWVIGIEVYSVSTAATIAVSATPYSIDFSQPIDSQYIAVIAA